MTYHSSTPLTAELISDPNICPVAALATEAAAVLRAYYVLTDPESRDDSAAKVDPRLPDLRGEAWRPDLNGTKADIAHELFKRLYAIVQIAGYRRATSQKGALFQAYLAANHGSDIVAELDASEVKGDGVRDLSELSDTIRRLMYSAIAALSTAEDDDLRLLRGWFFPAEYSDIHLLSEDLIAEVGCRASSAT